MEPTAGDTEEEERARSAEDQGERRAGADLCSGRPTGLQQDFWGGGGIGESAGAQGLQCLVSFLVTEIFYQREH